MTHLRTLIAATQGALLAFFAMTTAGLGRRPDRLAVMMILVVVVAGPGVLLTRTVLKGIVERFRRAPRTGTAGTLALILGTVAAGLELLGTMLVFWILLGVPALAMNPDMVAPALAGATGLGLGCLVGLGRPLPPSRETPTPPISLSPREHP